jgi:hypothetical protein
MRTLIPRLVFVLAAALLAAASGAAWAQAAAAGRFLSVTGEVNVRGLDGVLRAADRGSEFQAGETVVTGENALAQLRMADNSLLSLRGGSEFKLEQFVFAGKDDTTSGSFVVSVIKGGFRTITGLIAQTNRSRYRINTPSATIGVRGTHFEVVHVLPQIASSEAPAGTYNRVYEGITTLQNPAGASLLVSREQTAFASLQPGAAPVLVAPPAAIFGRPTPVPRAAVPAPGPARATGPTPTGREGVPAAPGAPETRPSVPAAREATVPVLREAAPAVRSLDPAATPISPSTTIPQPATTLLPATPVSPLEPARAIAPTTTITPAAPTPTILLSPATITVTPVAPATTTITPTPGTTILQAPTTTTIKPLTPITPVPIR